MCELVIITLNATRLRPSSIYSTFNFTGAATDTYPTPRDARLGNTVLVVLKGSLFQCFPFFYCYNSFAILHAFPLFMIS